MKFRSSTFALVSSAVFLAAGLTLIRPLLVQSDSPSTTGYAAPAPNREPEATPESAPLGDIQPLERKEMALSLALSPPCWAEDPAKLDDKSCYHLFEVAATYASYDLTLAYYVGVGNGALVALPTCEGGRTAACSVELARLYNASADDRSFLKSYYKGFETSLMRRSPQPLEITCSNTACVLTYT